MGYYQDLIRNKKYKRWKRHLAGIHPSAGPVYEEPDIEPLPGSMVKYRDILRIEVVDDVGIIGHNVYWYIYLYDFVKEQKTEVKEQYVVDRDRSAVDKTIYFDEGIDEKLGGLKQKMGD